MIAFLLSLFYLFTFFLGGVLGSGLLSFDTLSDSAVSEEDSKCLTGAGEAANPLSNSLGETVEKVKSLKEPTVQEQGNIPTGEQEHTGSDGSVPQVNIRTIPSLSKGEVADEKLVLRSVKFDVPYEQSLDTGCV